MNLDHGSNSGVQESSESDNDDHSNHSEEIFNDFLRRLEDDIGEPQTGFIDGEFV